MPLPHLTPSEAKVLIALHVLADEGLCLVHQARDLEGVDSAVIKFDGAEADTCREA
jgi:hypothetical protein